MTEEHRIERPIGITILSLPHLAGGLIGILFVIFFLPRIQDKPEAFEAMIKMGIPPVLLLVSIVFILVLMCLSGIGLWMRKKWGWFLGSFFYVYSIVRNLNALIVIPSLLSGISPAELSEMTHGPNFYYAKYGIRAIVHTLIYLYFFKQNVCKHFDLHKNRRWVAFIAHCIICIGIVMFFSIATKMMKPEESLGPELLSLDKLFNQGDFEGVIENATNYLKEHPDSYMVWSQLGWANLKLDNDEQARECLNRAIEIEPKWDNAYIGLGVLCRKQDDLSGARANYLKAISIVPDNAEAFSSLLVIELMDGNDNEAVKYGEQAWTLRNNSPTIAANLAIAYHYFGDTEKRDEFLEYARKLGYYNMAAIQEIIDGKASLR